MKQHIEQQLKQDGKAIKAQAEARLAQFDFSQQLGQKLPKKPVTKQSWLIGMAAAISLTVISWLAIENTQNRATTEPNSSLLANTTNSLDLKLIPLTIEQQVNQPLIQEQQAIIEDLKTLRKSIISI
jgi:hypothetical protein